jgi:heterotetrameric sarcosine oxidase gamma subunit
MPDVTEPSERTSALIKVLPGAEAELAAALGGMGLTVPRIGCFTESGGLLLARTGSGELLAMREGVGVALMDELAPLRAVAGLVDLSEDRVGVRIAGEQAIARLARLLSVDLDPSRFGPGRCVATLMAHLSVLVLQHAPDEFELQCGRGHANRFVRAIEAIAA